jgi:lipopolysaccharide/colanic/teichoic acid biosynthesis glycosyltransferase
MVLRGTMSLVGPRPEMAFFHRRSMKTIPFYRYRLEAKPGLTGWAQIRYAHSTTEAEYFDKTAFDLWYVANRSIMVDAKIMLRTIGILLNRFGSK